jgi:hypothetical protein
LNIGTFQTNTLAFQKPVFGIQECGPAAAGVTVRAEPGPGRPPSRTVARPGGPGRPLVIVLARALTRRNVTASATVTGGQRRPARAGHCHRSVRKIWKCDKFAHILLSMGETVFVVTCILIKIYLEANKDDIIGD